MVHDTLNSDVRGNVDKRTTLDNMSNITGWCFHITRGICPLRVRVVKSGEDINDDISPVSTSTRSDVAQYYNNAEITECGWIATVPIGSDVFLEMQIGDTWSEIFRLETNLTKDVNSKILMGGIPAFVVADNFYEDPDSVRNFALKQTFHLHPGYHKGKRTELTYRFPGMKERFEQLLGAKITNWDGYPVSGCFQYCIAGDQLVYHSDFQQYAGVLFLTPNAPPGCGTQFFRSKNTKKMKAAPGEYGLVYPHGHLDPTDFDVVDTVGNIYNRIVLFDSQMIHAASCYFGNSVENGRLFQLFFFDIEK